MNPAPDHPRAIGRLGPIGPILLVALAALSSAAACATTHQFTATDRTTVASLLEHQRQAWNRGDLDGYMSGYAITPDLVFTAETKIRRGFQQTRASYRKRYGANRAAMGTLQLQILDIQPAGPDAAVVLGRWRLRNTPSAARGVFTVVLERRPEGWRIIHDHTSVAHP
ncbi:MAG TPA: nuclear transport factor 2 family protein [Kofleriaceae bacterium]|nr:nuclear transport factor 2 family protein [Kofleriaceae bacterium]